MSVAIADPVQDCKTLKGEAAINACGEVIKKKPKDAEAYYNRAQAFGQGNDNDRALADYTKAIQLDPGMARAFANRSMIYIRKGDPDKAIADSDRAIALDPKIALGFMSGAIARSTKRDFDGTIAATTKALELDSTIAPAYYLRSAAYVGKGDLARAFADADKAVSLDPADPDYLIKRADILRAKGDPTRAIADYDKAVILAPNSLEGYFGRGLAFKVRNEFDRAIADFNKVLDLSPGQTAVLYHRGLAYSNKRNLDLAIADYNKAIAIDPSDADLYFVRGIAYRGKGQTDLAIADFTKVLELNPKVIGALNNRGLAYAAKRDYDRAIADYDAFIAADPKSAAGVFNRGRAYIGKGDTEMAIAEFTKCIELDPKDPDPLVERGDIWRSKNNYDRAIADYAKAIELNPKLDRAYYGRGIALRSKRQYDAAVASLTKAIELNPRFAGAFVERGVALRDQRDDDRAIDDFTAAIQLDPKNADALYHRGFSWFRQREADKAIADYDRALEIKPRYSGVYFSRGLVRRFVGDDAAAIADFSKAIEINPKYDQAHRALGVTRFGQGDFAGASEDLARALAINNDTYAAVFLYLAGARAGTPNADTLRVAAARLKPTDWPVPVMELLLGTRTPAALLEAATTDIQRCLAQFYLGEWRLLNKEAAEAEKNFAASVDACPVTFLEYIAAAAELKRMGSASAPRAAGALRTGAIEIKDIALGAAGSPALTIARASFTGFNRETGAVVAERVEIEGLKLKVWTQTWEIPTIRLTKVRIPEELYRVIAEGAKTSRPLIDLFRDSTVDTVSIKRMTVVDKVLESDQVLTGITLKRLAAGLIGEARLAAIKGASRQPGMSEPLRLNIGEIVYRNINVIDSIRVLTGGGTGEPRRLVESTSINGMEMVADKATIRFGRYEIGAVALGIPADPFPVDITTLMDDLKANRQPDPAAQAKMVKWFRGLLRHFSIDSYVIENMVVTSPDGGFTAGGMAFRGITPYGFDLFELRGVEGKSADGTVRLGRFAIEKVDYRLLLDMMLDAAETGKEPDASPDLRLKLLPQIGAVRLAGLEAPIPGGRLSLGGVAVEMEKEPGKVPQRIALKIDRLSVPIDPAGPADGREQLLSMGYRQLTGDGRVILSWHSDEKAVVVEDVSINVDEVGRIEVSARLEDADLATAIADFGKPASLVGRSPTVRRVALGVTDLGFMNRLYTEVARSSGKPRETVPASLADELTGTAGKDFGRALAPGSLDALAAFIRQPGRITATAVPRAGQPPLTLDDIRTLGPDLLDRVTITLAPGAAR